MATTSTMKINDILSQKVQSYLGGSEAVMTKIFMDLSADATEGKEKLSVPKVDGLAVKDVSEGADQTIDTALAITGDELVLSSFKEVPDYIPESVSIESAVDIKNAFLMVAPKLWVENIENDIYDALLANTNTDNFNTGTLNSFDITDIAQAKKLQDKAKVSKMGRYLIVNADAMEILAGTTEFEDGSKSLSDEALRQGIVSQVKGYNVVQYDGSSADGAKLIFAHKDALAFANQKSVEFIEEPDRKAGREFISLRGKYGVKLLDSGNRAIVATMAA